MYTHHKNQIYYWLDRLIKYSFLKHTNWSNHDWRTNLKIGYSQIFREPFLCSKWIGRASDSHIYLTLRYNAKLRHSQFCSVVEVDALQFRRVLTRLTITMLVFPTWSKQSWYPRRLKTKSHYSGHVICLFRLDVFCCVVYTDIRSKIWNENHKINSHLFHIWTKT